MTPSFRTVCLVAVACTVGALDLFAQGRGQGPHGGDPTFVADRDLFHFLLANHDKIRRDVKNRKDGVETLTESDDPEIAKKIQEHVAAMYRRIDEGRPIRLRDPLFAELFRHVDEIDMKFEKTEQGIRVVETSKHEYVARLIQEHAKVVSLFAANGFTEAHKNHPLPDTKATSKPDNDVTGGLNCCGEGQACCSGEGICCQQSAGVCPACTAAGKQEVAEKKETDKEESKDDRQAAREKAGAAATTLFQRLSTRLVKALSDGGPADAISVCGDLAPKIAKRVGKKHKVAIGRTSFRLRNPDNKPPAWAEPSIQRRESKPQFLDLPDGRLGALLPIHLKSQCLTCHGSNEMIAEDVQTALSKRYPKDQATGFKEGELRGWFWVEVPAEAQTND